MLAALPFPGSKIHPKGVFPDKKDANHNPALICLYRASPEDTFVL